MTTYSARWPVLDVGAKRADLIALAGTELPDLADADRCVLMASPRYTFEDGDSPTGLVLRAVVKVRVLPPITSNGAVAMLGVAAENRERVIAEARRHPHLSHEDLAIRLGLTARTVLRHLKTAREQAAA